MEQGTVAALSRAITDGHTNSREVVLDHLERIEQRDQLFGAIRCVAPDAVEQAEASDEHRRRHGARSPLEGIPVVLKDNIDVAGLPTTAGALALADSRPSGDAHLVRRLRDAGAVVLAKANLSELANFLTDGMPSGYSSLGGQVLNPYDLALTPSGSSSGSAAAVALDLAPLALGTETDGSIISPAVHQSIVGFKPTLGLVSRDGVVPIAPSQDTPGPMARTVADVGALLAVIAGPDPADEVTSRAGRVADALRAWVPDTESLAGARLILISPTSGAGEERRPADKEIVAALQGTGASTSDAAMPEVAREDELFVLHYEFAPAFDDYMRRMGASAPIRSLSELRDWNLAHADQALKYGQTHVEAAVAMDHEENFDRYSEARRRDRELVIGGLEAVLGEADALVFRGDEGASWAARAGWPSICIPIGYSSRSRRPLGLTFVMRAWSDVRLLSIGAGVEKVCGSRMAPSLVNPAAFASRHI